MEQEQAPPLALPLRKSTKQSDGSPNPTTCIYTCCWVGPDNKAKSEAMKKKAEFEFHFCKIVLLKHFNWTSNFAEIIDATKHKLKATYSNLPSKCDF